MSLTDTEGLTIEDLDALSDGTAPEGGRRYELLGGSIVVNAAPSPRHQWASGVLHRLLHERCQPGYRVYSAPIDLDLPGGQRVDPDLVVVAHASIGDQRLSLPVLLIVELVSPSTAMWDTVAKRQAYAEAGIEHYWLVDTRKGEERFTALALGADGYEVEVESDMTIHVDAPVAVSVPLASLFEPPH